MPDQKKKLYLTTQEVAALLMVSPVTVRQWAQKGWLQACSTPGGHRRYYRHEVERFAREHGMALLPSHEDGYRVLIVEDDEQVANFVSEVISASRADVRVEIAHDGFEAGRMVQRFAPLVILLDLKIPGLDGLEVCRLLKSDPATKAIRIIAMTGYATRANVSKLLAAGAEDCLVKPLTKAQILDAIWLASNLEVQHK